MKAQRVIDCLRSEYTLDWDAGIPEGCKDPVAYFLLESRRGPDYLFATAAAALLRHCGLKTRLANGFYVDPEKYDPETGHTPVTRDDLHFWVEIATRDGDWLVVHKASEARDGQIVVARVDDEVTVKRLKRKAGRAYLIAENPEFSPIVIELARTPLVIEGIAIGVVRDLNAI